MTEKAFTYQGPDVFYGIPARDITEEEYQEMGSDLKRTVRLSPAYVPVLPGDELDDPLKTLTNEQFADLTPAGKGARTREAKRLVDEAGSGTATSTATNDGTGAGTQEG